MKYLLFTDLHMGVHNNSSVWLDASLMLAKEIVDVCFKNNITKVIFLGDFFNDRRSLNTKTISYAHEFISILKDLEVYIVIGNHDVYYRNTTDVHSMKMFNEFEHVTIVNDLLQVSDKITLVSWAADWSKATTPVIMGHFEINGCLMDNRTIFENSEFDVASFKNYEMVLSGHFHTPSVNRNVIYIGSAMPFTFSDVDSKRGYCIFDEDTYQLIHWEFKECPKYVIQYSNQPIVKERIAGNVVKLVYVEELSSLQNEKLVADIQLHEPLFLHVDFKNIKTIDDEGQALHLNSNESIHLKSNLDIIDSYIDSVTTPKYINDDMLKAIIKQLHDDTVQNCN